MATKTKNTALNTAVVKKLSTKQKLIIEIAQKAQKLGNELYKKGKIDAFDPVR